MIILITPLFWEPVAGTGERLTAATLIKASDGISGHILIRDDVLRAMYGDSADKLINLFSTAINAYKQISALPDCPQLLPPLFGLVAGSTLNIDVRDRNEALRVAALMYSSLASLDEIDSREEPVEQALTEGNKRFATQVRELVVLENPVLSKFFNRGLELLQGGDQVKFGFASSNLLLHFGMLHPVRQSSSVKDARAKLWELARVKDITGISKTGLMMAVPNYSDPTLGSKQIAAIRKNIDEIEREADSVDMRLWPAKSVEQASSLLCDLAG